jgi:hypothetical protein
MEKQALTQYVGARRVAELLLLNYKQLATLTLTSAAGSEISLKQLKV